MAARNHPEEPRDLAAPAPGPDVPPAPVVAPPGSPEAEAAGCSCPVLANSGYRTGTDDAPLIDPDCPLDHG
jgi:hypothetical protein